MTRIRNSIKFSASKRCIVGIRRAVLPSYAQMFRVLNVKPVCIRFCGWNRFDDRAAVLRETPFSIVGQTEWVKSCAWKFYKMMIGML